MREPQRNLEFLLENTCWRSSNRCAMKKGAVILAILLGISCKAQSPVVGLDAPYGTPEGAYYKDLNNELDKFVGTWKFVSGDTIFTIQLIKKQQVYIEPDYYDTLEGAYSYKVNGQEVVNTFPVDSNDPTIGGSTIALPNQYTICNNCDPNERRIKMFFVDPQRKYLPSNAVVRYISASGGNSPKISVKIYERDSFILPYDGAPEEPRVPYGEYLLVKQ